MKKLSTKIKEQRKAKGLTQYSVYPTNPNQISQIESGKIKNPTEPVLRIIAQNLDMDFEKLIEDTDWNNEQSVSSITEYAFSPTQVIVNLDKSGNIKTTLKSYPAFDKDGNENKYCPISGDELIRSCSKCNRNIENSENMYCMGCGKWLFPSWGSVYKIENKEYCFSDSVNQNAQNDVELIIMQNKKSYSNEPLDIDGGVTDEYIQQYLEQTYLLIQEVPDYSELDKVNVEEWAKKKHSNIPIIKNYFIGKDYSKNYYEGILKELQRYRLDLLENHGKPSEIIEEYAYELAEELIRKWHKALNDPEQESLRKELQPIINKIIDAGCNPSDNSKINEIVEMTKEIDLSLKDKKDDEKKTKHKKQ